MNLQIENEKRQSFRGGFAGLIHHFQLTPYPINRKVLQMSRLTILTSKKRHTFPADYLASLNNLLVVFEPSSQKKNETKEPILSCFVF
ncbi:unnamed protein product [Brassica oleracea var. botrytis]|uniref:Uncharacterized protein n=2 Tax=Brassica TaxID=3705 RepID=A0A3P6G092_BRAOL|nr:unnamed protein product [Brassica napus]VDD51075.1 unnamed protein product [Brassica oleracea]